MKLSELIIKFLNKIIMALENKKLSAYADLASANIDTTTKLVVLTGATKVNANLPVTNFIEDSLTSTSAVKPLSAKQGKALQDTKAPIANPTFTGTVGGVTKAMVGLGNVDNTSDANKPISTAQAAGLAPKASPIFTGEATIPNQKSLVIAVGSGDTEPGDAVYISNDGDNVFSIDRISGDISICPDRGIPTISTPVITGLQIFADNAAAASLATGTVYRTSTGVLMIKY